MVDADSLDREGVRGTKCRQAGKRAGGRAWGLRSKGKCGPCLPTRAFPRRPAVQGWHLWAHLCASGVVIYQPLKTLYKLLSDITQEGWLWCTAPRPVQWASCRGAPFCTWGTPSGTESGQPASRAPAASATVLPSCPSSLLCPQGLGRGVSGFLNLSAVDISDSRVPCRGGSLCIVKC